MNSRDFKSKLSGQFIVLDGPDGCGKSTQCELLKQRLNNQGVEVISPRDPGTTAIGEKIRQILLEPQHVSMTTSTELLLYMAARVQLWEEIITPALKQNKCVILDRWLSSTCAYQGYAGGYGSENVIKIAEDVLQKPWPDLTIILDVDLQTAAKRLKKTPDRMEQKGDDYHQKVREGFLELARQREDFIIIDAADDIGSVHNKVILALEGTFLR